jgi:hypothetical protein
MRCGEKKTLPREQKFARIKKKVKIWKKNFVEVHFFGPL